jgi:hypothetical protein
MSQELSMPRTTHRKMMLARKHYRLWWGVLETFTMSELKSDIAEKQKIASKLPVQVYETNFDIAVQDYLKNQEKEDICVSCGVYKRHSNPPRDWTSEDKVYCCLYCRDTQGMGHGSRCNKCLIVAPQTAFDEDNGY